MAYIDDVNLIEEIKSLRISVGGKDIFFDEAKESILRIIKEQPTADVVEVVRCGKCRKRNTEKCWCSQWEDDYETGFDENGFCSGGERRDT